MLHDIDMVLSHEVDHIIAEQHGGLTHLDNLAWSCFYCNHFKGPNIASINPVTGHIVPLFNPRIHQWRRHFHVNGARIDPLTTSGRATANLLEFNSAPRVQERLALLAIKHYP